MYMYNGEEKSHFDRLPLFVLSYLHMMKQLVNLDVVYCIATSTAIIIIEKTATEFILSNRIESYHYQWLK